ncbi:hypothetical protein BJV77DRAFT_1065734 [Russula vinacea]|nr:hypothetical protein BJV77DRAFT_1065734 [Russula vinacea]
MKLPSSSSLLLASLAISSSSSSLSALAAPTGDCPEDSSSPAPVPNGSDDTMAQPNKDVHKLLDGIIGHLQDVVPLNARQGPLDAVKALIPRAEGTKDSGTDAAPEDSSTQPPPSEPQASAPSPAAAPAPPAAPKPPVPVPATPAAGLPIQPPLPGLPVRRDPGIVPDGLLSPITPNGPPNTPVSRP